MLWPAADQPAKKPSITFQAAQHYTVLQALNDSGVMVGSDSGNSPQVYVVGVAAKTFTQLPFPFKLADGAVLVGINNEGLVCGYGTNGGNIQPFIFDYTGSGTITWIPPLPGSQGTYARAISLTSRPAAVAGIGGDSHAFFYEQGVPMKDLGAASRVNGLNNQKQVVGSVVLDKDPWKGGLEIPVLWQASGAGIPRLQIPLLPGCTSGNANAINSAATVVGSCGNGAPLGKAFIHEGTNTTDLSKMIRDPVSGKIVDPAGWQLSEATGINDAGQIIGNGIYNGTPTAFLLSPEHTGWGD